MEGSVAGSHHEGEAFQAKLRNLVSLGTMGSHCWGFLSRGSVGSEFPFKKGTWAVGEQWGKESRLLASNGSLNQEGSRGTKKQRMLGGEESIVWGTHWSQSWVWAGIKTWVWGCGSVTKGDSLMICFMEKESLNKQVSYRAEGLIHEIYKRCVKEQ